MKILTRMIMKLDAWELELLAASSTEKIKVVEDEVWGIIVKVLSNAIDKNSLEDSSSTQEWLNELLEYRNLLKDKTSLPIAFAFNEAIKKLQDQMDDQSNLNMDVEEAWLADQVKKKLLTPAPAINKSIKVKKVVEQHKKDDVKYLALAMNNMTENAFKTFKGIIRDAITQYLRGGLTTQQAITRASYKWADQGIPALIDSAGKHWAPDVYVRLVMSNSINDLYNDVEAARFKEYGGNLVKISSHADCRPTHLKYQDKIYSLEGKTDKYPNLYTSTNYGYGGGLCGINCRHHLMPYIPETGDDFEDKKIDVTENNRNYKIVQQQRGYENKLREAKRRLKSAKAMGDQKQINQCKKLANQRSKKLRNFISLNHLTRDYFR